MTGRTSNAVRVPEQPLALLARDALARYEAMGLLKPGDLLHATLSQRWASAE